MKGYGEAVTDLMIIEKVMRSMPKKFDYNVVVIEESKDASMMKIEEIQSSIEAHEMRLMDKNPIKGSEQALKATHFREEERKKGKKWKGKKNIPYYDWPDPSERKRWQRRIQKQRKYDKSNVEFFNYHKPGHHSYDFPVEKEKDDHLESWYLDSGCLNHMTSHKEWLIDFHSSRKSKVKFVDDSTLKVEGAGDVVILRNNGSKALISYVLFVPSMRYNLLSIGQLVQKGFRTMMGNGQVEVFDGEKKK
ncbi:PREDICTED: uncharacterized protein LOC109342354 [Lupinus angustifolius]|uniref:uncharacterized protein LOC109342354 n=1 Tax=Lupinus angustifolius TaxID=3871 RepID=UPI00092E7DC6|nr:PREDICTED: uncharacterized protein LOC109342354 [Lupinus angustifolius]